MLREFPLGRVCPKNQNLLFQLHAETLQTCLFAYVFCRAWNCFSRDKITTSCYIPPMNITIIGTGFVGVVSSAVFASFGHQVFGLDIDEKKIEKLNHAPI